MREKIPVGLNFRRYIKKMPVHGAELRVRTGARLT
jgi:hypothetical protein|tara:strand:- start:452 stop:556 length:105 start_codon:yes stop_codon:yes gene_type:complete